MFSPMTSSLEKSRDFENRVILKKWGFSPMTSSMGFSPMTSSLEKSRDFENRVILKKWGFSPMTSSMGFSPMTSSLEKSRDFENRMNLKKRVFSLIGVTAPPRPDSPSGTLTQKYNLRSHVIDIE